MVEAVVICFGNSGHGKDALANMIAEELRAQHGSDSVLRCAFADPLKAVAMLLFAMPREIAYGSQQDKLTWKKYGFSARELLQKVGTEGGRRLYSEHLWVDGLAASILSQPKDVRFAVGSDGRFWSERDLKDRLPGVPVRLVLVWRPSAPDLGAPPTFANRFTAGLMSLPVVRHVLGLVGIKPRKLMHQSESEVWEMRQRARAGERLFDDFVVNDGTLDDLRNHARRIAQETVSMTKRAVPQRQEKSA
jgi:hypothetical protein